MLKHLAGSDIPLPLHGPALLDELGLPRYWCTVWSLFSHSDLSSNSIKKQLQYIESLYLLADSIAGPNALDDAISNVDIDLLGKVLESYFISIRNQPTLLSDSQYRWQVAFGFVRSTILGLSKSQLDVSQLNKIQSKLKKLELLYTQLRVGRRRTQESIRSLPYTVVEALFELLDPLSKSNPFRSDKSAWRVFTIFILMLRQGFRRGELLSLSVDAIKRGYDTAAGQERSWINVNLNPYEQDTYRFSKPSIKTINSIRQVPISENTAMIVHEYINNYRGRPAHSFLMNSQHNKPLSTEAVSLMFSKINRNLPKSVLNDLQNSTGKSSISAHDLRHTCSVAVLAQLLAQGDNMEIAQQKMRAFFGWSRESMMPLRYARAVYEDRLAKQWNTIFDNRLEILRNVAISRN